MPYSITPDNTTVEEDATTLMFTVTRTGALLAETLYASGAADYPMIELADLGGLLNQPVVFALGATSATFTWKVFEIRTPSWTRCSECC